MSKELIREGIDFINDLEDKLLDFLDEKTGASQILTQLEQMVLPEGKISGETKELVEDFFTGEVAPGTALRGVIETALQAYLDHRNDSNSKLGPWIILGRTIISKIPGAKIGKAAVETTLDIQRLVGNFDTAIRDMAEEIVSVAGKDGINFGEARILVLEFFVNTIGKFIGGESDLTPEEKASLQKLLEETKIKLNEATNGLDDDLEHISTPRLTAKQIGGLITLGLIGCSALVYKTVPAVSEWVDKAISNIGQ